LTFFASGIAIIPGTATADQGFEPHYWYRLETVSGLGIWNNQTNVTVLTSLRMTVTWYTGGAETPGVMETRKATMKGSMFFDLQFSRNGTYIREVTHEEDWNPGAKDTTHTKVVDIPIHPGLPYLGDPLGLTGRVACSGYVPYPKDAGMLPINQTLEPGNVTEASPSSVTAWSASYTSSLPGDAFASERAFRKKLALSGALLKAARAMDDGRQEKANRLVSRILDRCDGTRGGENKDDWITDPLVQNELHFLLAG